MVYIQDWKFRILQASWSQNQNDAAQICWQDSDGWRLWSYQRRMEVDITSQAQKDQETWTILECIKERREKIWIKMALMWNFWWGYIVYNWGGYQSHI